MHKARILLVDDDASDRADLAAAAEGQGDVETASSRDEAISKLDSGTFDLVVTDLRMDRDDTAGFQVLSAAKPGIPVIVITRYPSQGRSRMAMEKGALDFLDRTASGVDPFVMLRHKIGQALELSMARQRQLIHASE